MRVQWIKGHSDTELDAKDASVVVNWLLRLEIRVKAALGPGAPSLLAELAWIKAALAQTHHGAAELSASEHVRRLELMRRPSSANLGSSS